MRVVRGLSSLVVLVAACQKDAPVVVAATAATAAPDDDDASVDAGVDASASGSMFGDAIGDSFGAGGLGLSGVGEGCVEGAGIGVGGPRHVCDAGAGGAGADGGAAIFTVPRLRAGPISVNGPLPPEVVQRIVRQNFGRFRRCYESGLSVHPGLAGLVQVRFEIDRQGSVANARDDGSTLPNANVVTCVVAAFGALTFPGALSSTVTVVYPITFAQSP
jgi:hypothetical protein